MQKYIDSQKWTTRKYAKNQLDIILRNQHWWNNKRVLDVGCGKAVLSAILPCSVISCDVYDPKFYDIYIDQCPAEKLKYEDKSFNTVFLLSVLEHTKNPRKAIQEAFRVLKPKGQLIIAIPNGYFWKFVYPYSHLLGKNIHEHAIFDGEKVMSWIPEEGFKLTRKINIMKSFFDMYEFERIA